MPDMKENKTASSQALISVLKARDSYTAGIIPHGKSGLRHCFRNGAG